MKNINGLNGGDMELSSIISNRKLLFNVFLDPHESQPHDGDVKAVPPKAVLYNIPTAFNRQSGHVDFQYPVLGLDQVIPILILDEI